MVSRSPLSKPGPKCKVCIHPRRRDIVRAAKTGRGSAAISREFSVPVDSIRSHMAKHARSAADRAAKAVGFRDFAEGVGLVEEGQDLYERTLAILARTERRAKSLPVAIAAIREARGNLELIAKLTGKLAGSETTILIQQVQQETLAVVAIVVEEAQALPSEVRARIEQRLAALPTLKVLNG